MAPDTVNGPAPARLLGMTRISTALVALVLLASCGSDGDTEQGSTTDPVSLGTTTTSSTRASTAPAATAPLVAPGDEPVEFEVEVVSTLPHDTNAFTQGLVRIDDGFYESTGLYGQSTLAEVADDGTVRRLIELPEHLFGEGLEQVEDRLIQLTYREGTAVVYDIESFTEVDQLPYDGEGWGLCLLGDELIMSNGSDTLTRRHPETFAPIGEVTITLDGEPINRLNELECVGDTVWANVWGQDIVVGIQPTTGAVHSVIDAGPLVDESARGNGDVLNGIAYDAGRDTFFLTGKNWPTTYEVRFVVGDD